jgi:CheY-like chemotaxis protein
MSKKSILVVDEDESVRSYLSAFLNSCGYNVECAESGDRAVLKLASGFSPLLIMMDILMPHYATRRNSRNGSPILAAPRLKRLCFGPSLRPTASAIKRTCIRTRIRAVQ